MADVKLTKNALREQQTNLNQLNRYLPTLQLKKAMLQTQVFEVKQEISTLQEAFDKEKKRVEKFSVLLGASGIGLNPKDVAVVTHVEKTFENIAGVEVPERRSKTR